MRNSNKKVATWIILFASAMLCFGQTAAKRGTWDKSKQCADQAAKVMADAHTPSDGEYYNWNNHYSPKYNRCFIEIRLISDKPLIVNISTELQDAFERRRLAYVTNAAIAVPYCNIEGDDVPCPRVRDFIAEHMRN